MMWQKSWWECRFRVALAALVGVALVVASAAEAHNRLPYSLLAQMLAGMVVPMITLLLAGSGVNSQTSWGMLHGFHASMYFLLSMPVSRRRALLIRAAVGGGFTLLFTVAMMGMLALLGIRHGVSVTTLPNLVASVLTAFAWFGFATFLTTLFDEFWGGIIGLTVMGFVFGLGISLKGKPYGLLSILAGLHFNQTGDIAWPAVLILLTLGAAFMAASVYVVERKEY